MKKTLLLFCLFGLYQAQAQVTFNPGVRAGLNLSKYTGLDGNNKADLYIGVFGALKLSRFYTLQPEIHYSRQGMNNVQYRNYYNDNYYSPNLVEVYEKDLSVSYLGVNLINKFAVRNFNFHFGPGIDVVVDSPSYVDLDVDLTINLGLGYDFTEKFGVELRFKKGLLEPLSSDNRDFVEDSGMATNRIFQLGVTYKFE